MTAIPSFSELPLDKNGPHHNAWGLYGKDDELGTLNRLTDEIVKAAASEIKSGTRISLNWPLDAQADLPLFGRQAFHKEILNKSPRTGRDDRTLNDDAWTFNTQSSSQWDGFRHFGYQTENVFYNGVTQDDIHGSADKAANNKNGIGAWSEQGIVGRGVLLDFHEWRTKQRRNYDVFDTASVITADDLRAVAKDQGVEFRFGDILLVRSGWIHAYNNLSRPQIEGIRNKTPLTFGGVEQSEDMLQFLWSNFSACAGDQIAWESWPSQKAWKLHEVMLAGWGMPIGELFDLERLSAHCKKTGRYSFFLTSEVVNVPGGVASPPNILAIF